MKMIMINFFKRKVVKDKYKRVLNYKMAHPEKEVPCPKCGNLLEYAYVNGAIEARCPKRKCIMGNSRGIYKYQ